MAGGHAWQGGMRGMGCAWQGACVAGGMHDTHTASRADTTATAYGQ